MKHVTHQRLLEVLRYEPETGDFVWLVNKSPKVRAGDIAGQPESGGYTRIKIDGVDHLAHRLAWFYVHGYWPANEIDHINRVRNDNRTLNLRAATSGQNKQNSGIRKNNKSGFIGVCWDKKIGKWKAQIKSNYRLVQIGFFDSPENASKAYLEAKKTHHKFCIESN